MTEHAIPLGDAAALGDPARRTRIVRLALALALGALAIVAFFEARSTNLRPTPLLPPGSSGVIALDASGSVEGETLDRIYASLSQLANSSDRFGMVVFASRAYEALPPNTPAQDLKPLSRFFRPVARIRAPNGSGVPPRAIYPPNPWQIGFDTGTEISRGLVLAMSIILASPSTRRSVWLISDLADDSRDLGRVRNVATQYIDNGIDLNVIALNPTPADARFFSRVLGPSGSIIAARPSTAVRLSNKHRFPVWLIVAVALIAAALAASELWSSPLRWAPARVGAQ